MHPIIAQQIATLRMQERQREADAHRMAQRALRPQRRRFGRAARGEAFKRVLRPA